MIRLLFLSTLLTSFLSIKKWFLNLPSSIPIVLKRTWRGRERAIAIIAGVFLATLVITTVFAYGSGLSKAALKDSVDDLLFDGKIVKSGKKDLAVELEKKGYDWIKEEINN